MIINEFSNPLEFSDLLISRSNSNPYLCITSSNFLIYLVVTDTPSNSPTATASLMFPYSIFKLFLQTNPIKQITIILRGSAVNSNNGRNYNTDPYAVCSTLGGCCFNILPVTKYTEGRIQPPVLSVDFLESIALKGNTVSNSSPENGGRERRKSSLSQSIKNIFRRESSGLVEPPVPPTPKIKMKPKIPDPPKFRTLDIKIPKDPSGISGKDDLLFLPNSR